MHACLTDIIIAQRYKKYNVLFVCFPNVEEFFAGDLEWMDKKNDPSAAFFGEMAWNHARFRGIMGKARTKEGKGISDSMALDGWASKFCANRGAKSQEYFVYFKILQRRVARNVPSRRRELLESEVPEK